MVQLVLDDRLQLAGSLLALVPGLEHHAGDGRPGHVELEDVVGLGMFGEVLVDGPRIELTLLEGGVGSRRGGGDDDPLVLLRGELGLGPRVEKIDAAEDDQSEDDGHRDGVEGAVQQPLVALAERVELAVEKDDEFRLPSLLVGVVGFEQLGAHHRREGQGDDPRDGHRADQGEGELGEQRAGESPHEADRDVDRDQHHGHDDDRVGQLPRGDDGRLQRRQPLARGGG